MRTWTNKTESVTEEALLAHEFGFSIADGTGYYKIKSIPARGANPVVSLIKINNHPDNPDNYGEPEKLHRLDQLISLYFFEMYKANLFANRRGNNG